MHIYTHFVQKTYKGFWYSVQRFKKICLQIIKKTKQTKTKTEDCIGQVYLLYRNISCRPVITLQSYIYQKSDNAKTDHVIKLSGFQWMTKIRNIYGHPFRYSEYYFIFLEMDRDRAKDILFSPVHSTIVLTRFITRVTICSSSHKLAFHPP